MSKTVEVLRKPANPGASRAALGPFAYFARREHYLGPPGINLKVKFFLTGCLFPLLCSGFALAGAEIGPSPAWQSGHFYDYVSLLLQSRAQLMFLPLILYSSGALALWLFWPRSVAYLAVRLGVYAGIPLALQYLFLVGVASYGITLILSLIVGPVLALLVFLAALLAKHWRYLFHEHLWILLLIFLGTGVAAILYAARDDPAILVVIPFLALAGAPALAAITYIRAAIMVATEHRRCHSSERRSLLIWLLALQGLAAAWFASWRLSLDVMLFEYSKLPKEPPDCYVSVAARHRHAWLFGETTCGGVSMQTKRLKFLELALRAAAPILHAALRRFYNHYGPPLANFCRKSPWFADVSYLVLLPLEAFAALLRRVIQLSPARIAQLYSNRVSQDATKKRQKRI